MSSYQDVRVLRRTGRSILLLVEETHPDMAALAAVVTEGGLRTGSTHDAVKLGAMLLLDEKARIGAIRRGAADAAPTPEEFVADVAIRSAEQIGADNDGVPRYRATIEVVVTRDEVAEAFANGESWGAAAYVNGDFGDLFG
jgi:hypothetical protein